MSSDRERMLAERGAYPAFVTTDEQRRRFDLCLDRAAELFEEPRESGTIRQHAITMYKLDVPTEPGAGLDPNDPAQAGQERSRMGDEEKQETRTEETETETTSTEKTTSEPAQPDESGSSSDAEADKEEGA